VNSQENYLNNENFCFLIFYDAQKIKWLKLKYTRVILDLINIKEIKGGCTPFILLFIRFILTKLVGFCEAMGKPLHKCYNNGFYLNDESFYSLFMSLTENTK
jgi:hypothetical protein